MQVEPIYTKYAGRVPPLDLTQINTNCRNETEMHALWAEEKTDLNLIDSPTALKRSILQHQQQHHPYYNHHQHHHQQQRNETKSSPNLSSHFNGKNYHNSILDATIDNLPLDPRDWSRADVWKWLISMAVSEGLEVTPELPQKFPMNGKALCLMTVDMYLSRVPVGGKMLYRDFRVRLARAMASLT